LGPAVSVGAGAAVRAAPELSLEFLFKVEGPGYINIGNRHRLGGRRLSNAASLMRRDDINIVLEIKWY